LDIGGANWTGAYRFGTVEVFVLLQSVYAQFLLTEIAGYVLGSGRRFFLLELQVIY
jgi:hypothetical protein